MEFKNPDVVEGPAQYTDEWYSLRKYQPGREPDVLIGASESSVACGISKWKTPLELFLEKRGYVDTGNEPNMKMRLGTKLEPVILDIAEELLPETFPELHDDSQITRGIPVLWTSSFPSVGASPDGVLSNKDLVDAKATFAPAFASQFGEEGTDEIPDEYIFQAQQQMYVTGAEFVYFPVFFGWGAVKCYRVPRSETLMGAIVDAEVELVERIRNDDPPEPHWQSGRAIEEVRKLHGECTGEVVEGSPDLVRLWTEKKQLDDKIAALEAKRKEKIAKVMEASKGAAAIKLPSLGCVLKRIEISGAKWEKKDLDAIKAKLGKLKRRGYWYLREVKESEK